MLTQFKDIFRQKKVLITGHTGFKGSWLSLWLTNLGAEVFGISKPNSDNENHWNSLHLEANHFVADIRCFNSIHKIIKEIGPDIIFHLAAQPLVIQSYRDPLETWSTNVIGTANVLEVCKQVSVIKAIVVVTTDKCYENSESDSGFVETDQLGGHDPYSASKAACELVCKSYRDAFFHNSGRPLLATARAGNVIGGGDWAQDRLLPDLVRATMSGRSLEVRSPRAVRPWQHVLESLSGYLLLGQNLLLQKPDYCEAWNFGPNENDSCNVQEILNSASKKWPSINWHISKNIHNHESKLLYLDSSKARHRLGWHPTWNTQEALASTIEWYKAWSNNEKVISHLQLSEYVKAAYARDAVWISK